MDPVSTGQVPQVELADGDLLLRRWRPGDVQAVFEACQDPAIQRWTRVPAPYTLHDARDFVATDDARWRDGTPTFAMVDARSGSLLGAMGVVSTTPDGDAEIGYWVVPAVRGLGYAKRGLALLARWLFDRGFPRLVWHAEVGNVASRRVAESAGFVVEGTARKGSVHRGQRVDAWMASLLPSDLRPDRERHSTQVKGWPTTPVRIRSQRLLLREQREEDAPALLAYARDPVARIWDPEDTVDIDAAKERARWRADWSAGNIAVWAIVDPDDTEIYGGIQLFDVSAHSLHGTVGYGLMPAARGRGLVSEALRAVCEWAFTSTELNRIQLSHAVENEGSCAVARAAGFSLEGVMRKSYRFGDGSLHDEHLHARLRSDPLA
jgi:RimJ/RimL family protein N-acetyltransferase